jgi:hypothetical protein
MADIFVTNLSQMTFDDVEMLDEEQQERLCLTNEFYDLSGDEESFFYDCTVFVVNIDGIEYMVCHGFPGDNSQGTFFVKSDVWCEFGEGEQKDYNCPIFTKFMEWYKKREHGDFQVNYTPFPTGMRFKPAKK